MSILSRELNEVIARNILVTFYKRPVSRQPSILNDIGYFNTQCEEIYGKLPNFMKQSLGAIFLLFMNTELLKKYIKLLTILQLDSRNVQIWI